jgi:acetyl-CoA carboxylase biotin carboxyl carrier protein
MPDKTIKCPLPGIFYRRPSPDADPYVTEGQKVSEGDVVGLVEIMKNFHEIRAEAGGVIDRFLVANEDPVEADQDIAALR